MHPAPFVPNLFPPPSDRAEAMAGELSLQHVTNIIWAYASLKWSTPGLMTALVAGVRRVGLIAGWRHPGRCKQCSAVLEPAHCPQAARLAINAVPLPVACSAPPQRSRRAWPASSSTCSSCPTCCGAWPSLSVATRSCGRPALTRCARAGAVHCGTPLKGVQVVAAFNTHAVCIGWLGTWLCAAAAAAGRLSMCSAHSFALCPPALQLGALDIPFVELPFEALTQVGSSGSTAACSPA